MLRMMSVPSFRVETEADGDGTSETKPNMTKTLEDLGGHKVEKQETSQVKPDDEGTSETKPNMTKTLEDLGGHKVEKEETSQVKPDDEGTSGKKEYTAEELNALKNGGGTQHELEQKAEGTNSSDKEDTQPSSYPEATGADDSQDRNSRLATLQDLQNRRGR